MGVARHRSRGLGPLRDPSPLQPVPQGGWVGAGGGGGGGPRLVVRRTARMQRHAAVTQPTEKHLRARRAMQASHLLFLAISELLLVNSDDL